MERYVVKMDFYNLTDVARLYLLTEVTSFRQMDFLPGWTL